MSFVCAFEGMYLFIYLFYVVTKLFGEKKIIIECKKTFTRPGMCPRSDKLPSRQEPYPPLLAMHTSLHFLFGPFSHKILDRPLPIFNPVLLPGVDNRMV